ncbi:hypothetical protein N9V27_00640 [bacterium]|jgi:hypothetical protein|nr:hypothetical protein [bacterium]
MAYLSAKDTQAIRKELKVQFPEFRFNVSKRSGGACVVTITSGPTDFSDIYRQDAYGDDGYCQVNVYHIKGDNYNKHTEFLADVLNVIKTAPAKGEGFHKGRGWFDESDSMSDYFHTAFYIDLNIGQYSKPYVQSGCAKKAPTKEVKTLEQLVGAEMASTLRELAMVKENV